MYNATEQFAGTGKFGQHAIQRLLLDITEDDPGSRCQ